MGIPNAGAPPVPLRRAGRIAEWRNARAAAARGAADRSTERPSRQVLGHGAALRPTETQTLIAHRSRRERVHDCPRRATRERVAVRRALVAVVARGARPIVDGGAVDRLRTGSLREQAGDA